jgi:hypothetical protein
MVRSTVTTPMRNERAAQEVHDPPDQDLALGVVKTRDLARRLRDVLDMRVQLSVLPPESRRSRPTIRQKRRSHGD